MDRAPFPQADLPTEPNMSRGTDKMLSTQQHVPRFSKNPVPENLYVPPHLRVAEPNIKFEITTGSDLRARSPLPGTEAKTQQYVPTHMRNVDQMASGDAKNAIIVQSTPQQYSSSPTTSSPPNGEFSGGVRLWNNTSDSQNQHLSNSESPIPTHRTQSMFPSGGCNTTSQVTSNNEDAFLKYMDKQTKEKAQGAKMKSSKPPTASQNSTPKFAEKVRPAFNIEAVPKFKTEINESSDGTFQSFLAQSNHVPVTNGKKYTKVKTGSQRNGQGALRPAVSTLSGFTSRAGQQKENVSPFSRTDPHAFFSPRDLKTPELSIVIQRNDHVNQIAAMSSTGHRFQNPLIDMKLLNSSILADLNAHKMLPASPLRLTQDMFVENLGFSPQQSINIFEDRISDTGISEQPREIIRATQGKDATEHLLDWDGKMLPAPCDWETDRGIFDTSFIPNYIKEWQGNGIPCGPSVTVDTSSEGFRSGNQPVANDKLDDPVIQPDSIPGMPPSLSLPILPSIMREWCANFLIDIDNSKDEYARMHQNSFIDALNYAKRVEKRQRNVQRAIMDSDTRLREIISRPPEVNPFSASTQMYLRPATKQDASGIAFIYNHYVNHAIVTEDQQVINEEDILFLIENCQAQKLPIIVAVRGSLPSLGGSKKLKLPQFEAVIGYAFAEIFNFGLKCGRRGRSRATATLQFYVHHEYTRKGIGRNLLDHLMHSMSFGYAFKSASSWVNPDNDEVYEAGGGGNWHQLLVQLPVQHKDDPTYPWFKRFMLSKFFFREEARLSAVGRSSSHQGKAAVWLDLVFFQAEAAHGDEFQFEG
jgi:L-amino acid N-acyltransferase YncA